jgi:transcriptional regulator with XRE-family HTH domain
MNLAQLLRRELQTTSLRDLHAKTGLAPRLLRSLARGRAQEPPDIQTLQRLAKAFQLPLWCVLEMAGVELEQTFTQSAFAFYVAEQIEEQPLLRQLYERLVNADDEELAALLAYLSRRMSRQFAAYWDTETQRDEGVSLRLDDW